MKDKRTLATILSAIIVGLAIITFVIWGNDFKKKEIEETDAMRFKREYEALNDTTRESDGAKYNNLEVDKENPFIYIDTKKALEIIDNEDAIIYVGAPWCPWCRNAVPVLIDVAKKYNIKEVYYLDLDNEKSVWEVEDGKAVKKINGTKSYYQLLEKLDEHLRDYTLTNDDGKSLETGEKRIYIPYVIGVKRGRVVADKVGTVDLEDNQTKYDYLTDEQKNELSKSYQNIFDLVYQEVGGSCNKSGECE